jgi:DNA invertase Pin-like site-specific DNA recombinase
MSVRSMIIYVRYSDDEQRGNHSVEYQLSESRRLIATKWPDAADKIRLIKDEAVSGRLMKRREGFQELLRLVMAGEVSRVVVFSYSRLGRNQPETEIAVRRIEMCGVEVWSTQEPREPFVRQILGAVNEQYSRQLAAHSRAGMCELARRGFAPGGPIPFGYVAKRIDDPENKRDKDGTVLRRTAYEVSPTEAQVVVRIFEMADKGLGIGRIARTLTAEHVPPPRGGDKGWEPLTIRSILRNSKYVSLLRFNQRRFFLNDRETRVYRENPSTDWIEVASDYIPPIVSRELWDRVQETFTKRKEGVSRGPHPRYALSGIVVCATCGASCQVTSSDRKGHRYRYLRCGHAFRRGPAVCANRGHAPHDDVLEKIVHELERQLFTEDNIAYLTNQIRKTLVGLSAGNASERKQLERRLADVDRGIQNLIAYVEVHGPNDPEIAQKLRQRRAERQEIENAIRSAGRTAAPKLLTNLEGKVRALVGKTLQLLTQETLDLFKTELRKHVKSAELHEDGSVRVVGTLEGLLQGTTLQCNLVAGVGFEPTTSGL